VVSQVTRRVRTLLWAAALAALPLGTGCVALGHFKADVAKSRDAAVEAWQRSRAGQQDTLRPTVKGALSLDAAQLFAMGNNKQLLATLQEKEVAAGRLTEAWSALSPTAALTASYQRLDKVSSFAAAPGMTIAMGSVNNYALNLELQQPIFSGGAIQAGIRAARVGALMADEQVRTAVQGVLFQTRKVYFDVLLATELVKVSESDLDLARRHLADVEKKLKAGTAKEFDVLRSRVEITNIEAELIGRQNAARVAAASLLRILGVAQDSQVALSGKLEHQPIRPELDAAVTQAFRQRPELLLAELAIRLQNEMVGVARAGWFPMLSVFFTQTYAKPDPRSPTSIKWGDAWTAGGNAAWTIFDGFKTSARVRQERAKLRQQEIGLMDTEEQVLLEVQQALLTIEDAEKLVLSQSANIERAREGLRLAEVGYRAGVTSEVEVLDARQALSKAQALYYQALYAHMMARLLLEKATGVLEPPGKGDQK